MVEMLFSSLNGTCSCVFQSLFSLLSNASGTILGKTDISKTENRKLSCNYTFLGQFPNSARLKYSGPGETRITESGLKFVCLSGNGLSSICQKTCHCIN